MPYSRHFDNPVGFRPRPPPAPPPVPPLPLSTSAPPPVPPPAVHFRPACPQPGRSVTSVSPFLY